MLLIVNGLLLAAAAWAALRLWRRRDTVPPEAAPFALFALLGIAVHLPPSASPRMLLPLVPLLVWLIAEASAPARTRNLVVADAFTGYELSPRVRDPERRRSRGDAVVTRTV